MMSSPCVILAISYLLLADICEEGIDFVSLFDEPGKDA